MNIKKPIAASEAERPWREKEIEREWDVDQV